jgi:S1-C subfamily serine protease
VTEWGGEGSVVLLLSCYSFQRCGARILPRSLSSALLLVALIFGANLRCFGKDKPVKFETIPSGAQVEVNGTVVCTTPCSINVPSEYLGYKFDAFSKHAKTPIVVRLLKAGCAPKTVTITAGPIRWRDGFGIGIYSYFEVMSPEFTVQLEIPYPAAENGAGSPATPVCGGADPIATKKFLESAAASIVTVSAYKKQVRGFLISSDGLIVTDGKFITDVNSVKVVLPDGKTVKTSQLFVDSDHGLGLLKIEGAHLPYLLLNKTLPISGADVFTVDPPARASNSPGVVNQAIVGSARDYFDAGVLVLTDRPLDRDTPGTPLLNREGQVVGVSTAMNPYQLKGANV